MSTRTTSVRTRRTAWSRATRASASGTSASPGAAPRAGAGNQASSTVPWLAPLVTTLARPNAQAVCSLTPVRLLAGPAVDALAEEVGVTAVPGVLLDHVHDDVADLDLLAPVLERVAEVPGGLQPGPGMPDLATPRLPRVGDDTLVG